MKAETKVGLLFVFTIAVIVAFAYYLGVLNPFSNSHELKVQYNFAGGIEVGSPVRVMGIKVGKVKSIDFDPKMKDANGKEVKLAVRILVKKDAWETISKDSKFFINLAGVIGEKFLEITPGTLSAGPLEPGQFVRGVDPPRVDQLISQGYGLAGKILEFVEKNEGSVTNMIDKMSSLVDNLHKALELIDGLSDDKRLRALLDDTVVITSDVKKLTRGLNSAKARETYEILHKITKSLDSKKANDTYDLVHRLLWRLDELDKEAIRVFLQEEGIKAKLL